MATSLHGRKILKEQKNAGNSYASRDLIDPSKVPSKPSLSYFFSITITQPPKIRIRIPKILVKTMQRRREEDKSSEGKGKGKGNDKVKDVEKQAATRKQVLSKKVGRILHHVFNRRRTQESTCSSNDDASDLEDSKEGTIKSSKTDVNDADKQTMWGEAEEEGKKKKRPKQPKQGQSSFRSLFNKQNGLTLFRGKTAPRDKTYKSGNGVGTTAMVIARQESSQYLPRVPSRILTTRQRLKVARSMRTKSIWGEDEQEDGERVVKAGMELCKKRILMGEKCKPLNNCGTLQYDEDGVLLPEIIP